MIVRQSDLEEEEEELPDVPKPARSWNALNGLICCLAVFIAFVGGRVGFLNLVQHPMKAIPVAFTAPPPAASFLESEPTQVQPAQAKTAPATDGDADITLDALTLVSLPQKGALVRGNVKNQSQTLQKGFSIEIRLVDANKQIRKQRTVPCCDSFDEAAAALILTIPDHEHFANVPADDSISTLNPGETKSFSVIFKDIEEISSLMPIARITYPDSAQ